MNTFVKLLRRFSESGPNSSLSDLKNRGEK